MKSGIVPKGSDAAWLVRAGGCLRLDFGNSEFRRLAGEEAQN